VQETDTFRGLDWRTSSAPSETFAVAIAWSLDEPGRTGEICALTRGEGGIVGRDEDALAFVRWRPEPLLTEITGPIRSSRISRKQLRLRIVGDTVEVENLGRNTLRLNGRRTERGAVGLGGVIALEDNLVLTVVRHATNESLQTRLPPAAHRFAFGGSDAFGMVGESAASWTLRDAVAQAASMPNHALLFGPAGSGKELAARAIHALSSRGANPLICCSAEAFGVHLLADADGSTLLLDGVPDQLPAELLRALDHGEYRDASGSARQIDFRLIVCAREPLDALPSELASRLGLAVGIPALANRRLDIPLLVGAFIRKQSASERWVVERFFNSEPPHPRVDPAWMERMLMRDWTAGVRELEATVIRAITQSKGQYITLADNGSQPVASDAELLRLQACEVDMKTRTVRREGRQTTLTPTEHGLLAYLVAHSDRTVPKEELLSEVWGYAPGAVTHTVSNAMRRLRQKIEGTPSSPRHLLSVYGVGYRFET